MLRLHLRSLRSASLRFSAFANTPQLVVHGKLVSLSRDVVVPTIGSGMVAWREKLFAQMHHNASGAADFLNLPNNSVVELGSKIEI